MLLRTLTIEGNKALGILGKDGYIILKMVEDVGLMRKTGADSGVLTAAAALSAMQGKIGMMKLEAVKGRLQFKLKISAVRRGNGKERVVGGGGTRGNVKARKVDCLKS